MTTKGSKIVVEGIQLEVILDECSSIVIIVHSFQNVSQVFELSVIRTLEIRLDWNSVFQIQGVGVDEIIDHDQIFDIAIGDHTEILHANTLVWDTALSEQSILDDGLLWVENLDHSFSIVLSSACENDDFEFS